jgi:hypothetical protein
MSTDTPSSQESTGTETDPSCRTVTGPHDGRDSDGHLDHRYWRCQRCGLETTDPRLREGCFRCAGSETTRDESIITDRDEPAATDGGAADG